jgi:hypothetical protein
MYVAEYYLSPGFYQNVSIKQGAQFLCIKAFPNTYGSADIVMYMLEDESVGDYESTNLQCVGTNMFFKPSGPLEYLGSCVVAQREGFGETVHIFKEI